MFKSNQSHDGMLRTMKGMSDYTINLRIIFEPNRSTSNNHIQKTIFKMTQTNFSPMSPTKNPIEAPIDIQ